MINQTYNGTERGEYVHKKDFEAITIISPDYENQRFKIGESAFAHSNLKKVVIGDFETIGDWAFQSCSDLSQVMFSPEIIAIGEGAFSDCTHLRQIILPENLVSIGKNAFKGCKSLKEIIIYGNLKNIDSQAFMNCYSLERVVFPKSIETIGDHAFANCISLREVDFQSRDIAPLIKDGKRDILQIGKTPFFGCKAKMTGFTPYACRMKKNGQVKYQKVSRALFEKIMCEEDFESLLWKILHNGEFQKNTADYSDANDVSSKNMED
ncbi:MAG: leucine-rich repeat domain-containing protein [Clostridia bacterium]|nr:leucine-rich repeat domain-containing protein [Clostridia bacterium]